MELLLLLGVPFAGGILLGFWGHRNFAPELNAAMSLFTFLAAAALTVRIIADGPILVWDEMFFVDSVSRISRQNSGAVMSKRSNPKTMSCGSSIFAFSTPSEPDSAVVIVTPRLRRMVS